MYPEQSSKLGDEWLCRKVTHFTDKVCTLMPNIWPAARTMRNCHCFFLQYTVLCYASRAWHCSRDSITADMHADMQLLQPPTSSILTKYKKYVLAVLGHQSNKPPSPRLS